MTTASALHIGALVLAGCWLVCGAHLTASRERAPGLALITAAALTAAAVTLGSDRVDPAVAAILAGQLCAPAAVIMYGPRPPRPRWPHLLALCLLVLAVASTLLVRPDVVFPVTVTIAVVLTHLWWRLESLPARERRSIVWIVLGLAALACITFAVAFALPEDSSGEGVAIASFALPALAMVIGTQRPDLVDATAIVVEAGVLAVVALTGLALYVGAASLLTLASSPPPVGVQALIALAVAAALPRVRRLVHDTISELIVGRPPDPIAAVAQVASVDTSDAPLVLTRIREALALPYVAVGVVGPGRPIREVAASGRRPDHERTFPLVAPGSTHSDEVLVVGLRPGELQLSRTDTEVLSLLARLIGQIRRADLLTAQLTESRAATRHAVEEERRRLRRELHDGLGPTLSGIVFTADAAANLTRPEDGDVRRLLDRLSAEATTAVGDVRRLAYDIRPPALDQLGLSRALERVTTGLGLRGVAVTIAVDDSGDLPAAVEVAVYRIATEAVTNVMRHGRPARVGLQLTRVGDTVTLRVSDDSPTTGASWSEGVGVASMRERAEELGGSLRAGPTPGGWIVEAILPLESAVPSARSAR